MNNILHKQPPTLVTAATATPLSSDASQSQEHLALQLALMRALGRGTADGFTQAEADKVMAWAHETLTNALLLELALDHLLVISFGDDGTMRFNGTSAPDGSSQARV